MKTVIEIAREAGFVSPENWHNDFRGVGSCVERFAELVRADEREACAKVCDELIAWNMDDLGSSASAAIRARGNTEQKR